MPLGDRWLLQAPRALLPLFFRGACSPAAVSCPLTFVLHVRPEASFLGQSGSKLPHSTQEPPRRVLVRARMTRELSWRGNRGLVSLTHSYALSRLPRSAGAGIQRHQPYAGQTHFLDADPGSDMLL